MIKSFELCKWTNPASATNNNSASSIPHSYLVKCATIANMMLTTASDKRAHGSWHLQRHPKPKSSSTVAPTHIRLSRAWNAASATKELSFYLFFHFNDFKWKTDAWFSYWKTWWWTGRPGVLRFMGSHRVGRDWATELNWSMLKTPWGCESTFSTVNPKSEGAFMQFSVPTDVCYRCVILEKETATCSSIPAWNIPWTEEAGRLQSTGLQKSQIQLSD